LLLSALIFNAAARSEEPGRAAAPLANPVAAQPLEQLPAIVDRSLFSPSVILLRRHRCRRAGARGVCTAIRTAQRYLLGVVMDGQNARPLFKLARTSDCCARRWATYLRLESSPNRWAQGGVGVAGRPFRHLQALHR